MGFESSEMKWHRDPRWMYLRWGSRAMSGWRCSTCPRPAKTFQPSQDASFPTLDHFSGDINKYGGLLLQCSLAFARSLCSFYTDYSKISYIIGLLRSRAPDWALAFFLSKCYWLLSFYFLSGEFKEKHSITLFTNAAKTLLDLKQGFLICC